jgi:FkbM family methyltransferase
VTQQAISQAFANQVEGALNQMAGQINQALNDLGGKVDHINLSLKRRLYALEAAVALQTQGKKPVRPIVFRSQFGEDCAVWELLNGQTSGFFVEAGAFDGRALSVTDCFAAMGWTGVLVEANPEVAATCKVNRPESKVVQAALGDNTTTGQVDFTVTQDQYGGMLSFLTAGGEKPTGEFASKSIRVPMMPLNDVLGDHTGVIDLVSLDVEGAEVLALKGFDLAKFKPRVLLIEDNNAAKDTRVANYMASQDYVQIGWVAVSRVYVHRGEQEIFDRIARGG